MALSTVATADAVTVPSDQFPTNKFPENETIIWRYMDVASFAWLLQTKCLLFRRVDKFSDKHEGVLSRPTLRRLVHEMEERIEISLSKTGESLSNETARAMAIELERGYMDEARRQFYVNCWHASDVESFAMWHEYSQRGVAIRSTVGKLLTAKNMATRDGWVMAFWVTYVDLGAEEIDQIWPHLFKRREYGHEREIRAVLHPQGVRHERHGNELTQFEVKYSLPALIDEVRVAPGSQDWFYETVCGLLKTYRLGNVPCNRAEADQLEDFLAELAAE